MVRENLSACRQRITEKASASGRRAQDIVLVVVTKTVEPPLIFEALDNGVTDIGESKVQEALLKFEAVNEYAARNGVTLRWHMVGHLQTNKVKEAVRIFDLIQSVDSLRLAEHIDRCAASCGKVQDILLEVKTSFEATKSGFAPSEVASVLARVCEMKNLRVRGLMTIAPFVNDPKEVRRCFCALKDLIRELSSAGIDRPILSMGMSDDFETALEEGSNMVRLGRIIFGERKT